MRRLLSLIVAAFLAAPVHGQIAPGTPPRTVFKSYTFAARTAASGVFYLAGFYESPVADADLTNASPAITVGSANAPYAAHAFIVASGNGTTNGSTLILTVSGVSINDAGTRNASASEVIEATAATSATNTYFETSLKWLGPVTFTLTSDGDTFNYTFNYGLCKYEDFGNRNFTITDFEAVGLANATDTGFNVQLLHHEATGWVYSAAAFEAGSKGSNVLFDMNVTHGTDEDTANGEPFAMKVAAVGHIVAGAASEGFIVRVTTGANNSISYMNAHVGVTIR